MINNKNSILRRLFATLSIIILYFFSRFQNLTAIPVFGDEAIYIRWSQIIKSVETLRFIPVTDGKQPLFMWMTVIFFKFIKDPLVAGRTLSIFCGFATLISLFLITSIIKNYHSKITDPFKFIFESINNYFLVSLIPCFIYTLLPFTFFFDRMALPDNMLSFFGSLALFFSLLSAKFKRLDLSIILGFSLGLSWLTKSPTIYFVVLSVITYMAFTTNKNIKSLILPAISVSLAFIIYNILRLGPQFHMIALRNKDYIWTISDIIRHPLDPLVPHLWDIFHIYSLYISLPLIFLFFLFIKKKLHREHLILLAWFLLPLIANAAMAKVFTARYILFTLPPLIILLSLGATNFLNSKFKVAIFLLSFVLNINTIYQLSLKPFVTKLSSTEQGYLSDWTSGWGIKESSEYFKERSGVANVIVGTEGSFGTLPDGLQIYTQNTPQLTVFGVGLGFNFIPEKLIDAKNHGDEVYLLLNKSRNNLHFREFEKIKLIQSYPKPQNDSLDLYQII